MGCPSPDGEEQIAEAQKQSDAKQHEPEGSLQHRCRRVEVCLTPQFSCERPIFPTLNKSPSPKLDGRSSLFNSKDARLLQRSLASDRERSRCNRHRRAPTF